MPTIYETRSKTGKIHKTKHKRAEILTAAYRIRMAAEQQGLNKKEVRQAILRFLYGKGMGQNSIYNYLNCTLALAEAPLAELPLDRLHKPLA